MNPAPPVTKTFMWPLLEVTAWYPTTFPDTTGMLPASPCPCPRVPRVPRSRCRPTSPSPSPIPHLFSCPYPRVPRSRCRPTSPSPSPIPHLFPCPCPRVPVFVPVFPSPFPWPRGRSPRPHPKVASGLQPFLTLGCRQSPHVGGAEQTGSKPPTDRCETVRAPVGWYA